MPASHHSGSAGRKKTHRALVIGMGSIGQRHARLLGELGYDVDCVSKSSPKPWSNLEDIDDVERYDYAIIANPTSRHPATIEMLTRIGFNGTVLIEKPLAASVQDAGSFDGAGMTIGIGYNLRFHPVVAALRQELAGREVHKVIMHAGQHLADWRPGRDYRETSSAFRAQGGGVLRDLSHELDLAIHLFGPVDELVSDIARESLLALEVDEACSVLARLNQGTSLSLTLNYHDRPARRAIHVTTGNGTLVADIVAGTLSVDGEIRKFKTERDETYLAMHRAMLGGGSKTVCTVEDAKAVMHLIDAIEKSHRNRGWISL